MNLDSTIRWVATLTWPVAAGFAVYNMAFGNWLWTAVCGTLAVTLGTLDLRDQSAMLRRQRDLADMDTQRRHLAHISRRVDQLETHLPGTCARCGRATPSASMIWCGEDCQHRDQQSATTEHGDTTA